MCKLALLPHILNERSKKESLKIVHFWGERRGAGADWREVDERSVPRLEVLGRDGHDPEDPTGGRRWESAERSARQKHCVLSWTSFYFQIGDEMKSV